MLKELLTNSLHIGTLHLNVHMYKKLRDRLFIDDDSVYSGCILSDAHMQFQRFEFFHC